MQWLHTGFVQSSYFKRGLAFRFYNSDLSKVAWHSLQAFASYNPRPSFGFEDSGSLGAFRFLHARDQSLDVAR